MRPTHPTFLFGRPATFQPLATTRANAHTIKHNISTPPALTCISLMWAFLLPPVGVALRGAPLPIVLINVLFTLLGECVLVCLRVQVCVCVCVQRGVLVEISSRSPLGWPAIKSAHIFQLSDLVSNVNSTQDGFREPCMRSSPLR